MTAQQLAHEFMQSIRNSMFCSDEMVAGYEEAMAYMLEGFAKDEREACAKMVEDARLNDKSLVIYRADVLIAAIRTRRQA